MHPETPAAEKVETPEHIADKIWSDWQDAVRTNFLSVANPRIAIAQALTSARFRARRECERELAALGLKVAFQDEGVAEQTFAECKEGHILDHSGVVRNAIPVRFGEAIIGWAISDHIELWKIIGGKLLADAKEAK